MTSAQPDGSDVRRSRVVLAAAACALFVAAGIAAAGVANPPHEVLQEGARLAVVLLCSVAGLALPAWLVLRPSRHRPRALGWFSGAVSLLCLSATADRHRRSGLRVAVRGDHRRGPAHPGRLLHLDGHAEYFALVALNVVEYTSSKRVGLLAWRGNLAARLLYWPVLTTLLLAATVAAFLL